MSAKLLGYKIAMLLVLSVANGFAFAQAESKIVGRWDCFENTYLDPTKPIIRTWIYEGRESGKIEANGIVKDTTYTQQGLHHRWDFDYAISGRSEAAFVIKPNNKGVYYYFGAEESVSASLVTECKQQK